MTNDEQLTQDETMKTVYSVRGNNFSIKSVLHPSIGVTFHVWADYPKDHKIEDHHIGKQVWIAGRPKTAFWSLVAIHPAGTKMFPKGGYTVKEKGSRVAHNVEMETVILHPDNFKRSRTPVRTKLLGSLPKTKVSRKRK